MKDFHWIILVAGILGLLNIAIGKTLIYRWYNKFDNYNVKILELFFRLRNNQDEELEEFRTLIYLNVILVIFEFLCVFLFIIYSIYFM